MFQSTLKIGFVYLLSLAVVVTTVHAQNSPVKTWCWFMARGQMAPAGEASTTFSSETVTTSAWCKSQRHRSKMTSPQPSASLPYRMGRAFWSLTAMAEP